MTAQVDDQYLTEMSHKEAIGFLRATASTVLLHFCRRRGDGSQAERVTATGQGARHGKRVSERGVGGEELSSSDWDVILWLRTRI